MADNQDNNAPAEIGFSKEMRNATRDIHKLSDALVKTKLAFALTNDAVWSDGLLVFYEIFKFLEENVGPDMLPPEYHRLNALESDLKYYLGANWKNDYIVRPEVAKYIEHIAGIHATQPLLLLAYVYHLYMGLLSGGQILTKKRSILRRFYGLNIQTETLPGEQLTNFENFTVAQLKKKLRNLIDTKALGLNADEKNALLLESRKVFELNNEIIRTIKGVNKAGTTKILTFVVIVVVLYLMYKVLF